MSYNRTIKKIKFFEIALAFLFCYLAVLPVKAKDPLVVDNADLLSSSEERELEDRLEEISEEWECDVVILTVDDWEEEANRNDYHSFDVVAFADDYFDYHDYGQGDDYNGILFLISMSERDWAISTCGDNAIKAFTDDGQEFIMDRVLPYLSDEDYAEAFMEFADQCDTFLKEADRNTPYDGSKMPREPLDPSKIPYCFLFGLIIAGCTVAYMKSQLKSVKMQSGAGNYIINNSLNVTDGREIFLYRTVNRVRREHDTGSGSHGSSVHRSSSGRSHGGSHGKF